MQTDRLFWFPRVLLVLLMIFIVVESSKVVASAADQEMILTQQKEVERKLAQSLPDNSIKVKKGYVVSYKGETIDKDGKVIENQVLLSVSKLNGPSNGEDVVYIRLEAVSETAKEKIKKDSANLPELVYFSVQSVAEKVMDLKAAKTKKAFDKALINYKKTLKEGDELVSLHGFQIVEDMYDFQKDKI